MATDWTPQQAAEQGLGWVPKGHPLYGTPGYVGASGGDQGLAPDAAGGSNFGSFAPSESSAYLSPSAPVDAGMNASWSEPQGADPYGRPPKDAAAGLDRSTMTTTAAPPAAAPAPNPADPFASIGGGVQLADGGWVPKGHPLAQQAAAAPPAAAPPGAPGAPPAAAPGANPIATQADNAQTYSATPGAAPIANTTNQGTQDVVRNSLLERATQGTTIDTNDPNFRQQADAFAGAAERQRRQELESIAQDNFASGTRGSGAEALERRIAGETAARNVGGFEAQLVGQELQNRRGEIASALESLRGQISTDQQLALQRELATLDAAIKRESLAQTGSLGSQDLTLRDKLGTGALNVDLLRALLTNQQYDKGLGVDIGKFETDSYFRSLGL